MPDGCTLHTPDIRLLGAYIKGMTQRNIRIASYNIRKARGFDQRWKPGRVVDVINTLTADVVVLQEADFRLGRRKTAIPRGMIATHSDFAVAPLAQHEESLGWHGNAVLVRPDIEVTAVERITLPGTEPRGAAVLALSGAIDLTLVATHLGLRRRDRRAQQAAICAAVAGAARSVVAGDFNEWSANAGLEHFARDFDIHAPGRSFPTRLPLARLDRFAVSAGLEVVASGVETGGKARFASDHLPVWGQVAQASA